MPATQHLFSEGQQVRWRWAGDPDPDERTGTITGLLVLGDHATSAYWIGDQPRCYVPVDDVIGLVRD